MAQPRPNMQVEEEEKSEDWLTTYADAITLLMAFFVMLVSFSKVDVPTFDKVAAGIRSEIGNHEINTPTELMMIDLQDVVYTMQADKVVDVSTDEKGIVLELASSAFYLPGSADIRPEAFAVLESMGKTVMSPKYEKFVVELEGHTDDDPISTPIYPSNWELSTARATRVIRFLIELGLDSRRLKASGYGASRPKVPNRDAQGAPIRENQATNRRVVVRVYPASLDEQKDLLKKVDVNSLEGLSRLPGRAKGSIEEGGCEFPGSRRRDAGPERHPLITGVFSDWRRSADVESHEFPRNDGVLPRVFGLGTESIHEVVVVIGIVVEDGQPTNVRHLAEPHRFVPGGMSPTDLGGKFRFGVGAVVDHQIGTLDQAEDVRVRFPRHMFRVGDVANRRAAMLDAIAGGAVGMVEKSGAHLYVLVHRKRLAGLEIDEGHLRLHGVDGHRKNRVVHLARHHRLNAPRMLQMAGHDLQFPPAVVGGHEEGEAVDVIPMGVGQQHIVVQFAVLDDVLAQFPDPGPGVQNDPVAADGNLDTTGIAPVPDMGGLRTGDGCRVRPKT